MSWTLFNAWDWAIVGILAISTLISLWRGFAKEAISLLSWVAAFILANMYATAIAELYLTMIENEAGRHVAAYVVVFVGTILGALLLSTVLGQLIKMTGLSVLDRVLGTVFGFARGLVVVLAVIYVARALLPPEGQPWVDGSQLMPHMELLMQWSQSMFERVDFGGASGISI